MYLSGYEHNGFAAIHALGYVWGLLILINQRMLNKLRKERNKIAHKWSNTRSA